MGVRAITSLEEFKEKINGDKVVILDFWATWCGPCRVISPIFEKLSDAAEHAGVEFYKVDVDTQQEISQEVGIRAMPTFIAYKKGEKLNELVGADPNKLNDLVKVAVAA